MIIVFTIIFVLDRYKSQELCIRAVNACSFVSESVHGPYKTQEMCDKANDYNYNFEILSW